jgi:hypothetical protein
MSTVAAVNRFGGDIEGTTVAEQARSLSMATIEGSRYIVPAPAVDFEVREVGLPEPVDRGGGVGNPVGDLHDDDGGAGDQPLGSEKPLDDRLKFLQSI